MDDVLNRSSQEFGPNASVRYRILIKQALRDIRMKPDRVGARLTPSLGEGVFVYHLNHSRDRAKTELGVVRNPRHFVVYRYDDRAVEILRILHDARDLASHILDDPEA